MFYKCKNLQNINELKYLNTKYCTNFSGMFSKCSSLNDIKPLENWNVSNGTDFKSMFSKCSSLKEIKPLENWKLSENNFKSMFNQILSYNKINKISLKIKKTKNLFNNSL